MTDCEKIIELLSAYYDDELSADECELVRRHVEACEKCAALLRLYEDMSGALSDAEPPSELRAGVMKSVMETSPIRVVNTNRIMLRRIIPAAACLALALLALPLLRNVGDTASDKMSMTGIAPQNEAAMMPAPSSALEGESGMNSYMLDEMAENFEAYFNEQDNGVASDFEESAEDIAPKTFEGMYTTPGSTETAADSSTEPWSPEGLPTAEGTTPPQTPNPAETPPQSLPSDTLVEGSGAKTARVEDYSGYYAVIKLTGEFPQTMFDKLDKNTVVGYDVASREQSVIVPRDIADALIGEGYDYVLYNADAGEAIVILLPSP